MTLAYAPARRNLTPAFLAAVLLHLGLFAALTLFASRPPMIPTGSAVPINIVSSAPATDSRPAEAAPEVHAAAVETPVPEAPPPAPAPAPPTPAPPLPVPPRPSPPKPTPAKAAARPTPAPVKAATLAKPQPAKAAFDLDALQASIAKAAKAAKAAPARPAFAARRGPARAETAPQARVDAGAGVSQSSMQGLSQLLSRLWNPNCNVQGGNTVVVPVSFTIGADGRLEGKVTAGGEQASSDPVVAAAARRAIDAVHEGAPYAPEFRGALKVIFDARKACA